jgi:hypothetical protein
MCACDRSHPRIAGSCLHPEFQTTVCSFNVFMRACSLGEQTVSRRTSGPKFSMSKGDRDKERVRVYRGKTAGGGGEGPLDTCVKALIICFFQCDLWPSPTL